MKNSAVASMPLPVYTPAEIFIDLLPEVDRSEIPRSATFQSFSAEGMVISFEKAKMQIDTDTILFTSGMDMYVVPKSHVKRVRNAELRNIWPAK